MILKNIYSAIPLGTALRIHIHLRDRRRPITEDVRQRVRAALLAAGYTAARAAARR